MVKEKKNQNQTCYSHNDYQGKHETRTVLTHYGLFQEINALNKLANKFNCSENFPRHTLRYVSQTSTSVPTQGISFHFFAVPPRQKEERALQGRMLAPRPPTRQVARKLCIPKGQSTRLCQCTTNEVLLNHREKEKSTSSRNHLENCNFRLFLFSSHNPWKKPEKLVTSCSLSTFYAIKSEQYRKGSLEVTWSHTLLKVNSRTYLEFHSTD